MLQAMDRPAKAECGSHPPRLMESARGNAYNQLAHHFACFTSN